jgi:nitrous oxide reductase
MTANDENQYTDPSRREFLKGVALAGAATLATRPGEATALPDPQPKSASKESPTMKVLMPIGDATEVMDTLYPFFRLPEDGNLISCRTWHDYGTSFMKDFIRMLKD